MGFQGEVLGNEPEGDVKVDMGGGDSAIADGFAPSGDDSPPLPGDTAALEEGVESGTVQATGYHDNDNSPVADPGAKRLTARNSDGVQVAEVWIKGDGSITIKGVGPGSGDVNLAGAVDFVALAAKVDAFISAFDTLMRTTWIPVPLDGGAALKVAYAAAFLTPPVSVAAEKVKAE